MFLRSFARYACLFVYLVVMGTAAPALAWTFCSPQKAAEESCLSADPENRKCLQLGAIVPDRGHRDIMACLATEAGANCRQGQCAWQAIGSEKAAVPSGTLCGLALLVKNCAQGEGPSCSKWESEPDGHTPCNGVNLIKTPVHRGNEKAASLVGGCPTGYRLFSLTHASPLTTSTLIPSNGVGTEGQMTITCVKD